MHTQTPLATTVLSTALALIAFAANSVLCRLALGEGAIDAGSFTSIRLLSGIAVLWLILALSRRKSTSDAKGSWKGGFYLFAYAVTFSFGYITLETGIGALILFGAVQITLILLGLLRGDRLHAVEWLGVLAAFAGFVYLVLPSVSTPSFSGFILMTLAGIAWGFYTLAGKGSVNPLQDTAYNFLRTLPLVVVLITLTLSHAKWSSTGVWLAVLSGGIASGVGYAIWYMALRHLLAIQAAVLQLLVPVLAAIGGVVFAGEAITARLIIATAIILGGILTVIVGKQYFKQKHGG